MMTRRKQIFALASIFSFCLNAFAYAQQTEFLLQSGERVVFLGDSITQAASRPEGYIHLIELFCGIHGVVVETVNAGISGNKSSDMLARLERDVLSRQPDWVSVSCGVNDVWHQFAFESEGIPLEAYKENMTALVDRIQAAGAKVILLTATPIHEDFDNDENRMLSQYNAFLRNLAEQKDALLVDLDRAFRHALSFKRRDDNLLTTDGVHMNPRGNRLMARSILRALGATGWQIRQAENRWELVNNM